MQHLRGGLAPPWKRTTLVSKASSYRQRIGYRGNDCLKSILRGKKELRFSKLNLLTKLFFTSKIRWGHVSLLSIVTPNNRAWVTHFIVWLHSIRELSGPVKLPRSNITTSHFLGWGTRWFFEIQSCNSFSAIFFSYIEHVGDGVYWLTYTIDGRVVSIHVERCRNNSLR